MEIKGAVALITGGASGLGEATARRLHKAGAKVVLVDVNKERGEAVAKEMGEGAVFVATNVADATQVQAAVDAATKLGELRIAVSCAGIASVARTLNRDGTPHELELFRKTIEVNLIGTFNVVRLAASAMAKNEPLGSERGVIVNTASVAALEGQIGQIAYASSKGGVAAMVLPAARDLSVAGIRVNGIAPGIFATPMMAGLPEKAQEALAATVVHPKRLGDPDEYAQLVEHMVTNSYLNGALVRLDGALRMGPK